MKDSPHRFRVLYLRRATQFITLLVIATVAYLSANPQEWSPSRIVLGHIPPPRTLPASGDTWAFKVYNFRIVHPVAFAEAVVSAKRLYLPLVLAVALPLLITLVFGRVFCSFFCPAGFVFELNQKVNRLIRKTGLRWKVTLRDLRVTILLLALVFGFVLSVPIVSVFDPPHVIGREFIYLFTHHRLSISGGGLILAIVLLEAFSSPRLWCSSLCPSGGGLSLIGKKRLLRIQMDTRACITCERCNDACPYDLRPMNLAIGEDFDWTKCDNCGLCRDVCPTGAISYRFGR